MISVNKEVLAKRLGKTMFEETALHKALQRVPELSVDGPWVAGGAVRRIISGDKLDSDFDFFFRDADQYNKFTQDLTKLGGVTVSYNENNVSFKLPGKAGTDADLYLPELNIQAIHFRFYESLEEALDSFDFTITQFGYDGTTVKMADFALWDLARRKLVPTKITYATATIRRMLKYADQGFTVCAGCISDILQQVVEEPSIIEAKTLYID